MSIFRVSFFSSAIFVGQGFVEILKFCCHGNVMQRLLLSIHPIRIFFYFCPNRFTFRTRPRQQSSKKDENVEKKKWSPIWFFNPVIPTQIFAQSPNPEGYFRNPPPRAHFQSRILPPFSFEIPNLIQYNNFI